MVTAPTVVDPSDWNFAYGDKQQMIEKQNAFNQYHHTFSIELAAMVDELNIEFQFVAETRIDITNKSGQVAADRQAVTQAKASVDASKAHIDQREAVIDATADEVSQNAQRVASDKQVVAQDKQAAAESASAASGSAGAAQTAKQQAEALYGDLDAVNAAKNASQTAAQTATEQAGLADTARQEAQTAAQTAGAGIDDHVSKTDPHTQYLQKAGGVLTGKTSIEKTGIETAEFELRGGRSGDGGAITRIALSNNVDNAQGFIDTWLRSTGEMDLELSGFRKLLSAMAVEFANGMTVRTPGAGFTNIDLYSGRTGTANIGGIRFWNGDGAKAGELLFTADGRILAANGGRFVGVDADKLNGQSRSVGADANTVAGRDSSGDIRARLFRTTYTGLNSNIAVIYTSQNNNGTDYMRPSSPDQVKAALGLSNVDNVQAPKGDWISDVGLASNNINNPYMRRRSDGTKVDLVTDSAFQSHKTSGDHDGRYYTKGQVDSAISSGVSTDFAAVGSYGIFTRTGWAPTAVRGESYPGSNLYWSRPDGSGYATASPSGTWQLRSHSMNLNDTHGLFMRIA
ncbi:hypothetical protein [Halomonas sp. KHS3]|uniref:hypothetical protein n=1 Tax=Halomonas sp. KHS3 TaxID=866350 RepID=UPI00059B1D9D|nr:hypothetical protein [Halomonas sp. KHS3]KIN13499.1 hypothetical protein RO22_19735 [Halomonas sp. KHS3]